MPKRQVPEPDFRRLFESAPGLYLVLDPRFTIVAVSDAYLNATMTTRAQVVGRNIFEVFPDNPEDPHASGVANLRASLERVRDLRRPDAMAVQKYDIPRPDAVGGGFEERHWSPGNSPVFAADGSLAYIIHRVEDVTEFVRLKREGTDLLTRAEQMEAEVYRRAHELQDTNVQLRRFQTELEDRVKSRTVDLERANQRLQREIVERERTERALKVSEEQLRQSQKMEAIGRLAGGIAHDFNNLLTVILSYAELVQDRLDAADPARAEMEQILRAGQRAADLTRQLLAFSRQQVLEPAILDLNEILTGLHKMLTRVLGEDIELRLRLAPGLDRVKADRGQFEQVVMNLAVNARDAMPQGGRLTIETANVELDEAYASGHFGARSGAYVMLAISDTGIGMDRATQARIFEPFFTTKDRSKGTGLGLSTVFGIVQQSGGNIWVYSEPGAGTTFKIYLPRAEERGRPAPAAASGAVRPRGSETILLVEDEEAVRSVAGNILRAAGYNVLEANTAGDALQIVERDPVRIDLLLTDVIMPKVSGRQVAERVRDVRPAIRVLFMSGYTDDAIFHHGVLDPGAAFIQKPLTPDALTRKVRQVLDANGDGSGGGRTAR